MSKRALFPDAVIASEPDFDSIGLFAQQAIDSIVDDVISYPAHWAGFTVSIKSAQEVRVSAGRFYDDDTVFEADSFIDVNLQNYLPVVASDEHWIALLPRGRVEVETPSRSFQDAGDDADTDAVIVRPAPRVEKRVLAIAVQQSAIAPPPALRPSVAETDCCIAFVRLTTAGVQTIEPGEKWRAKSLHEVEGRVTALEIRMEKVIQDTITIATDVAALGGEVDDLRRKQVRPELIGQFARDIAKHNQVLALTDETRNYVYDDALVKDIWDFARAGGAFRIREGIRFPVAQEKNDQITLTSPEDPSIMRRGALVLPAFDEVIRLENPEGPGRRDIANVVHTIQTAVQRSVSHQVTEWGQTYKACENSAGWARIGLANRQAGETFLAITGKEVRTLGTKETRADGHVLYDIQFKSTRTVTTNYVEYITETFGLNGGVYGQTFLNAQVMMLTAIGIPFTRVGATGDVQVLVCECDDTGAPRFDQIIAKMVKPRAELVVGWNKFDLPPTLLEQGVRYAYFTVTPGNHQVALTAGNAFASGSAFTVTDGAWAQGSTTEDHSFRLYAARFRASRTVVPLRAMSMSGGFSEITMLFQRLLPAGTALEFEVKPDGAAKWSLMDDTAPNPLASLPELVQIRAVFVGTLDIAPAMVLDGDARIWTRRMAAAMRAYSKELQLGFSTNVAQIVLRSDGFVQNRHTVSPKLVMPNNTVVSPSAVTTTVDRDKPSRVTTVANFALPSMTSALRMQIDGSTTDITDVFFGQDVQLNAFNAV